MFKWILYLEPILKYPYFTNTFILITDVNIKSLRAILSQCIGKDLSVAYASRKWNKIENNYSTTVIFISII